MNLHKGPEEFEVKLHDLLLPHIHRFQCINIILLLLGEDKHVIIRKEMNLGSALPILLLRYIVSHNKWLGEGELSWSFWQMDKTGFIFQDCSMRKEI